MSPVHTKAFAAFGILHTSVKTDQLSSNRCQRGKLHRHGPMHSSSWYVTLCVRMCVSITGQPWWLLHSLLVAAKGSLLRSKAPPLPLSVCLFSCLVSPPCLVVTLSLSFAMPACLVSLQIVFYTTFSTPAETENVLCLLVSVWFFSFSFLSLASTWPINSFSISILCPPVCGYSSTWMHTWTAAFRLRQHQQHRNLIETSVAGAQLPEAWPILPTNTH